MTGKTKEVKKKKKRKPSLKDANNVAVMSRFEAAGREVGDVY